MKYRLARYIDLRNDVVNKLILTVAIIFNYFCAQSQTYTNGSNFCFVSANEFSNSNATHPTYIVNNKRDSIKTEINNKNNRFSIGLSAGVSMPFADYGAKNFHVMSSGVDTSTISGWAKPGVYFDLSFGYKFSKFIGVMLKAGESINSFDKANYVTALNSSSYLGPGIFTAQNVLISGPHYIGQYLVGPCFTIPIDDKYSFEIPVLFGVMTSFYPKITEAESNPYYSVNAFTKYNNGIGFAYSIGLNIKYMLNQHIGVLLNTSYSSSNEIYKGYSASAIYYNIYSGSHYSYYSYNYTSTANKNMVTGILNFTGGLVYSF